MKFVCAAILVISALVHIAHAGDDASGPISYSIDLSQPFTTYTMTEKDGLWSESLLKKLNYKAAAVHFVKTSLTLRVDNVSVDGVVYQAMEKPEFFYVVNGDAMLKLNSRWAYNPGVGGF